MSEIQPTTQRILLPVPQPERCLKHRMWMKKGECSICLVEKMIKQRQAEQETGSNKPEIKIGKL